MDERQGFTLIELLAVIVILAVIALIATPFVLNIIERAEKGAFKDSVYGIMEAAEFQVILDGEKYPITFEYPLDSDRIKFKGTKPTEGYIQIVKEGKIKLALGNGRWCATKNENDSQVTIMNGHCEKIDLNRPIISGYGDLNQEINVNDSYTLPNVTASDSKGNQLNVTTTIKQGDKIVDSIDTSKEETYTITYTTEADKEGNISTVTVIVNIVKKETAIDKIITSGTSSGSLNLIDNIYYYQGSNPKNYIYFNNELWRIMSIEAGLTKIIKNESIGELVWDDSGSRNWTRPATLNTYLNDTYYNRLSIDAQNKIELTSFSVGLVRIDVIPYSPVSIKRAEKKNVWTGKVGLMNVSDYIYASANDICRINGKDSKCQLDNWLNREDLEVTINPCDYGNNLVTVITDSLSGHHASASYYIYPVVYLKSDIKIMSGDGSLEKPFILQA